MLDDALNIAPPQSAFAPAPSFPIENTISTSAPVAGPAGVLPPPTNAGPVTRNKGKEPAAPTAGTLSRSPSVATLCSSSASPGKWTCARLAERNIELEDQIATLRIQYTSLQQDVRGMSESLKTTAQHISAANASSASGPGIAQLNAQVEQVTAHFRDKAAMIEGWIKRTEQLAVDAKSIATNTANKVARLQTQIDIVNNIVDQVDPSGKRPRLDFNPAVRNTLPGPLVSTVPPVPSLPNPTPAAASYAPLPAAHAYSAQTAPSTSGHNPAPLRSAQLTSLGRSPMPTGDVVMSGVAWSGDRFIEFHRCASALVNHSIARPHTVVAVDEVSMCGRFASAEQAAAFVDAWITGPVNDTSVSSAVAYHVPNNNSLFNGAPQGQTAAVRRTSNGTSANRAFRRNAQSSGSGRRAGG